MKTFFNLFLVFVLFHLLTESTYTQPKPKDDSNWPDLALQKFKIEHNLRTTKGGTNTYNVKVTLDVINFGEKKTPVNKLNLKLILGAGVGSTTEYNETFNKEYSIKALNQDQKQSIVWKFKYITKGEWHCHDFLATVVNKVPFEFVINNNELINKTDCIDIR